MVAVTKSRIEVTDIMKNQEYNQEHSSIKDKRARYFQKFTIITRNGAILIFHLKSPGAIWYSLCKKNNI